MLFSIFEYSLCLSDVCTTNKQNKAIFFSFSETVITLKVAGTINFMDASSLCVVIELLGSITFHGIFHLYVIFELEAKVLNKYNNRIDVYSIDCDVAMYAKCKVDCHPCLSLSRFTQLINAVPSPQ